MGINWSISKYQSRLEFAAVSVMSLMMMLFGISFALLPNLAIFARLAGIGIHITPQIFALGCFVGMFGYPIMLHPKVKAAAIEFKQEVFMVCSFPILLYFLLVGADQIRRGWAITPVVQLGIYGLILLLSFAIFRGYRRWLELASNLLLAALMMTTALIFAFMPSSRLFVLTNQATGWNLVPISFAMLSAICAIGFLVMPFIRTPHPFLRRLTFAMLEMPIFLYGLLILINGVAINPAGAILAGLTLLSLFALVALLGGALYRNSLADEVGRRVRL